MRVYLRVVVSVWAHECTPACVGVAELGEFCSGRIVCRGRRRRLITFHYHWLWISKRGAAEAVRHSGFCVHTVCKGKAGVIQIFSQTLSKFGLIFSWKLSFPFRCCFLFLRVSSYLNQPAVTTRSASALPAVWVVKYDNSRGKNPKLTEQIQEEGNFTITICASDHYSHSVLSLLSVSK